MLRGVVMEPSLGSAMSPLGGPMQANLSRSLQYVYEFFVVGTYKLCYNIDITGMGYIGIILYRKYKSGIMYSTLGLFHHNKWNISWSKVNRRRKQGNKTCKQINYSIIR